MPEYMKTLSLADAADLLLKLAAKIRSAPREDLCSAAAQVAQTMQFHLAAGKDGDVTLLVTAAERDVMVAADASLALA